MKKLLGILVLGLLWCNVSLADSPYIFFDIEIGSKTKPKKFELQYKVDDIFSRDKYKFKPQNPNDLFENYFFYMSAISKTIISIQAIGLPMLSSTNCTNKMFWLRDKVIELKEKKFTGEKYKFSRRITGNYSIMQIIESSGEKTNIEFGCIQATAGDPDSFRTNFFVYRDSLSSLAINEWKKYKKDKIETKGF